MSNLYLATFTIETRDPISEVSTKQAIRLVRANDKDEAKDKLENVIVRYSPCGQSRFITDVEITRCIE